MNKAKIIAIVGPTGSGKTEWAKKIAQDFSGKIISFDSRQIYKGLDIGTGKDKTFRQELTDILEPTKRFTLWDYQKLAEGVISDILNLKGLPVLVGGTGLYLYAVLYGYVIPKIQDEDLKLRKKLEKLSEKKLYEKLKKIDPKSAQKIDPQNKRRIIRALEVSILAREPFSNLQKKSKSKYDALILGIKTNRETLYSKIDARIDKMITEGLVEEVRNLIKKYRSDLPALNTIGYKEIINYLNGKITLREAVAKIKTNTHDYVRRQETWFRNNKDVKWVENYDQAKIKIKKFLQKGD